MGFSLYSDSCILYIYVMVDKMKKEYPSQLARVASRLKGFVLILVLILWIAGWLILPCPGWAEIVDRIMAQVNADIITLYDLNQSLTPYIAKIKERGLTPDQEQQMLSRAKEDVLMNLINDRLTDQEVKKSEIEVTEGEVDDAIKRVMEMNNLDQKQLAAALSQDGMTLEEYRKNFKKQLLRSKLLNREVKSKIVITDNEINAYYRKHLDKFGGAGGGKYHLRTIIKKIPPFSDEKQKQSVFTQMKDILAQLHSGKPFDALAREQSDLLAPEGGDLGTFAMDELSPAIREAIAGLKQGGYTEIIDTDQGYQVFYLQEIRETTGKPIEEVSDEIRETLYNEVVDQKFQAWVKGLKQKSHIKIVK
jgi:peptidyl-prolyl cis-trans isomerase SurA